jgi:hypothetical protein
MATQVQDLKHLAGARFLVPFLAVVVLSILLAYGMLMYPNL